MMASASRPTGTSEPIASDSLCGLQRHAWREGKRAHGESPAPVVELSVWLFFFVAHFKHTQVRVCGTQQGIVSVGWSGVCVHSYTEVSHSTHITTLPFGPSTQLEFFFFESVGSSPAVRWLGYRRQSTV